MKTSFERLLGSPDFISGQSRDVKLNILYRKLMFLQINQLLKDEDIVRRFKRPMSLETFRTAHGFNVFLARAVRSSLNKFFVNLCRAGVLASPIPFDSHSEIAKDSSYDPSFCPLGKYPYTFSPKIFENLHSSGFGGLLPREMNELFRNLLTFNDSPEERLAEQREALSLSIKIGDSGGEAIRFRNKKQLGTRVTNAINKTPLFYSPLILFSLKKDRNVPRYTLTFAVRDRRYFKGLCEDWTLDYNTAPSPFVSYSFDREVRPAVGQLYWLTITIDYGYLLPTATDVLRSRAISGLPPHNFNDFLKFFVKIQNFFTDVFVKIYGARYSGAPAITRKFAKDGRGGLEDYLDLMEPYFTLSRFGDFPLLKRDGNLAEVNEGGSLFPLIEELVHTEKCFLISLEGKNHFGLEALFDNEAPEPEEEPPSLTLHDPDVTETSDIMPEVLAAMFSGSTVIASSDDIETGTLINPEPIMTREITTAVGEESIISSPPPAQDPRLWPRSAHPQITEESGVDYVADLAPVTVWDPGTMEDPVHHRRRVQRALRHRPSPEFDNSFSTMAQAALDQLEEGSSTSNISISASITDNRLDGDGLPIESIGRTAHQRWIDREYEESIELNRSLDALCNSDPVLPSTISPSPSTIPPFEVPHGTDWGPSNFESIEGVDPIPEVLANEIRRDLASMEEPGETSEIQVNPEIQRRSPFIGDDGYDERPLRRLIEAEALARTGRLVEAANEGSDRQARIDDESRIELDRMLDTFEEGELTDGGE